MLFQITVEKNSTHQTVTIVDEVNANVALANFVANHDDYQFCNFDSRVEYGGELTPDNPVNYAGKLVAEAPFTDGNSNKINRIVITITPIN